MATGATAEWWIRTDGDVTNGGGFDSGIASAGTNWSDQAAAHLTFTSLTLAAGTITDVGATGVGVAGLIGNCFNVPGQGYYWITAVPTSNTYTVTAGTGATTSFTTQPGKIGGALLHRYDLADGSGTVTAPGTTSGLAPGNTIHIRASGSGSVGSPDYPQTGYATYKSGDTTSGYISWVAYNGTPYVVGNGLIVFSTNYHKSTGIYFSANGASNGNYGLWGQVSECVFINCTFDANNKAVAGIGDGGTCTNLLLIGCELVGNGTTSLNGLKLTGYGCKVQNCKIHGWGAWGVFDGANSVQVINCAIYLNTSGGVSLSSTTGAAINEVIGCTIDGNTGDGVKVATVAAATQVKIVNNNITNNGGIGLNIAAGSLAAVTAALAFVDYNNVYNNTSGPYSSNFAGGAHDLNVDPGYTNASAGQFTPSNNALIAAAPIGFA